MRSTVALWVSLGFVLACSGLGIPMPGETPPEEPVPPSEPGVTVESASIGLLRAKGTACELVVREFGSDGAAGEETVVATLPKECPSDRQLHLAWADDKMLVSTVAGLYEVVPATHTIRELPKELEGNPQGVAFDKGVPAVCQDLESTFKVDGDNVVVTYKGKDWKAPVVPDAAGYALARWWRLDPDLWVEAGTEVLPMKEGQVGVCTTASSWPTGNQICPSCESEGEWRPATDAETTALAALGEAPWIVKGDVVAAHGTAPKALKTPLAVRSADGGWMVGAASKDDPVQVVSSGAGSESFQVLTANWERAAAGKVEDLGTAIAPFVWPESLSFSSEPAVPDVPGEEPVAERPDHPSGPVPGQRVPLKVQNPPKPHPPGEGKTGKGKAKAKAKAG